MKTHMTKVCLAIWCFNCSYASAENDLIINGFLNASAGVLSTDEISIQSYDEDISFDSNTLLGIQVTKPMENNFSLVGQLVARGSEDYTLDGSWLFGSYQMTPETSFRMGRLRLPVFYYSDFLEVGYSYNWISPPEEVYRAKFSSIDAIDVQHQIYFKGIETNIQFYVGRIEEKYKGLNFTATNLSGLVLETHYSDFTARLGYHLGDLHLVTAGTPLEQVVQINDAFAVDDFKARFLGAALIYDDGDNKLVVEWTAAETESAVIIDDTAWLIQYARRVNDLTYHVTYTEVNTAKESGVVGDLQATFGLEVEESSIITGVKYDISNGVALKFEAQYNDEKNIGGAVGDDGMLYSVALNMVF